MNILLTGVSKGVGLVTSARLLEDGYTVFGISKTKTSGLIELIERYPNHFNWLCYDLLNSQDVGKTIFKDWIGFNTPLNGFVNNAAIAYDDIITNIKIEPLESMFKINVMTPFMITKYAIRHMLLHNIEGSIVHLSSISVHTGYKGLSTYAATKGAIEAFSKNVSREFGNRGIRSNCVVAGFMDTDMSSGLTNEQKDRIYKRTCLKKAVNIKSVADTIAFLLSNSANSITGQNIFVDSGTI